MIYFFVCIGVILALKLVTASYKSQKTLAKRSYKFRSGFNVTKAEYDEAYQLLKRDFCPNEYCRKETVALFIEVKRNLAKNRCRKDDLPSDEVVFQYCKKITLDILDFQDSVQDDVSEEPEPVIIELIKELAAEVVRQLTAESDRSFYNSGDAWKVRYNHLVNTFNSENAIQFYEDICQLGVMSDKRITVRREIYYKACQFLIHKNKEYGLKLYLQYLHIETLTGSSGYKKITKANRQWFFRNMKEEQQFDRLCDKLIKNKDLKAALKQFDKSGIARRKKIQLDVASIREAAGKQARVAGLLSDLLADEPAFVPKDSPVIDHIDNKEVLLRLFIDKDYKLTKEEVDIFAQSKGIFAAQLIQRINEEHFDELDDVLIEEDNGLYRLNETYLEVVKGVR
jgi:hypothetical protein